MIFTGYNEEFDNMLRIRHGAGVRRYHTWPTIGEQTVAAHSWGVAMILLKLDPDISGQAVAAALAHDIAEGTTGDVPAPAKWLNPGLAYQLDVSEAQANNQMNINYAEELNKYEFTLVKAADMLELMFFCLEQRLLGNQRMDPIMQNGYDWMYKNISKEWRGTMNAREWAQYLGLAYISRAGGKLSLKDHW